MAQKKGIDYQRHYSYPQALAEIRKLKARVEELEWEVNVEWAFNLRQFIDCAMIALHKEFGFGADRNKRFNEALKAELVKWMAMSIKEVRETEQVKGCYDFWVTQHKMDAALSEAVGDVQPWEERYGKDALDELVKDLRRYKPGMLDKME